MDFQQMKLKLEKSDLIKEIGILYSWACLIDA
jgi:hypothetical protein